MSDKKFTLNDLKTAHADSIKSLSEFSEELCYHRGINVLFRPLKIKDKKDLLKSIESKDEVAINSNLDRIIEKYVTFDSQDFSSDELTIQERYQILTYIRRAAAGDKVKIIHQCPECEKVNSNIEYELSNMEVTYIDPKNEVDNTIKIGDNITLYLGMITRKDEKIIDSLMKKKKLKTMTERQIISLVGTIKEIRMSSEDIEEAVDLTPEQKLEFFEELDQSVIDKILDFVKTQDHGVKLPFSFVCDQCGYHNDIEEASVAAFFIS